MRHEDAGLALWLATDESKREHGPGCERLAAAEAAPDVARRSIRERAGAAVIALGVRLAGERIARELVGAEPRPIPRRPLARQAS